MRPEAKSRTPSRLLPPFATYSVLPSGERDSAFGALPKGSSSMGFADSVLATASVAVSIMDTVSLFAFATYRNAPSGARAMPLGCRPTSISFTTAFAARSMTETVPVEATPVSGSTTAWLPAVGPVLSPSTGLRPPQFDTYNFSPRCSTV